MLGPSTGEDLIEGGILLVGLAVAVVSAFGARAIAEAKGHEGMPYFWLGLFLPLIGLLIAGFMPPVEARGRKPVQSSVPSSSPTSAIGSASRGDAVSAGVSALADLRPPGDRTTDTLLRTYGPKFDRAIRLCAVGEHVLAFGIALWRSQKVLFLLTDRRFIFVDVVSGGTVSAPLLDTFEFDAGDDNLRSLGGVFNPIHRSPFSASEVADLIRDREKTQEYVEVIAPGELVAPKPSDTARPVADTTPNVTDTVDEIERIDALHRSGAIDDDEFAELKRRAMWGDDGPTESNG